MMHAFEDLILTYACNSLWQAPLIGAGALLAAPLLDHLGAKTQYRLWALSLVAAVVLPAATMGFPGAAFHRGMGGSHISFASQNGTAAPSGMRESSAIVLPLGLAHALLALFCLLVVASLSRFVFGLMRTWTLVRVSQRVLLLEDDAAAWAFCRTAFSIGAVEIRESASISGPVTCSWFRSILILPVGFLASCSSDERLAAFAHEAAHIERRDFVWNTLLAFLTLPIAYHPIKWFMEAKLAESRELICDGMAAERSLGNDRYANSLFRLASRIAHHTAAASIHAIGIFDANILEKRMMKLKQKAPMVGIRTKLAVIAGSIVIAGSVASASSAMAFGVTAEPTATSQSMSEQVFHVGNGVSAPVLIHAVDPAFPDQTTKPSGFEGVCVVKVVIGKSGGVEDALVVRALEPAFDKNAIAAVRQYRFKPGLKDGNPVAVSIQVEVDFRKY